MVYVKNAGQMQTNNENMNLTKRNFYIDLIAVRIQMTDQQYQTETGYDKHGIYVVPQRECNLV